MTTKADSDLMAHLLQLMDEGRQEGDGARGHWTMSPEWYRELCRRFDVPVPWGPNAPIYMFGTRVLLEVPGGFPKWHPYKVRPVPPGQPLPHQMLGEPIAVLDEESGTVAMRGRLLASTVEMGSGQAHPGTWKGGYKVTLILEVPKA